MPDEREILNYYPASYSPFNPVAPLRQRAGGSVLRNIAMAPYRFRFGSPDFEQRPEGAGRLLDIGCGAGGLLRRAADLGWTCYGIDLVQGAVDQARRCVPEADIQRSTLEEFVTDLRFDLIVMSHVLEHVHDPVWTLQRCRKLLTPNGRLLIAVPNLSSWEARLFGRYWSGLDVPRHLIDFREDVLRRLLIRLGFSVSIRPSMMASSISESIILMLPRAIRRRAKETGTARLLYLLTVFPAAVFCLLGNRGMIEVLAQRRES